MKPTIVLYTHTDVKDIWPIFFGQTDKYLSNYKKIILVNKNDEDIPNNYETILYDNSKNYIDRLLETLNQINDQFIIFHHEDMFLYDEPDTDTINKLTDYITNDKPFIRLMRGGGGVGQSHSELPFLKMMNNSIEYIFAIQPTIWKTSKFIELLEHSNGDTLWEFEANAQHTCRNRGIIGYYIDDNGLKRGKHHWDCKLYPYVATGISKGKWNKKEYPQELGVLMSEYNINAENRGTNE